MFKVFSTLDLAKVTDVPQEVTDTAASIIAILDRVYGAGRDYLNDNGGYVIILSPTDDISVLEEIGLNVPSLIPQHTSIIKTSNGSDYIHVNVLRNPEFTYHILMPKNSAPANLLSQQ